MAPIPATPLHRLLASDEGPEALRNADVVLGRDAQSGEEFVVFGREVLQRVSEGTDEAGGYNVLCVELDRSPEAPDLQLLLQLVESVKGSQEYRDYGSAGN